MNHLMQSVGAMVISIIVAVGFVGVCTAMLFVPVQDTTIGNTMFGGLSTGFALVLGYWLGSSSGSRAKDRHLANLAQSGPPAAPDAK